MSLFHCRKQCLGKFCTALFALIVWNNPNPDQFSGIRIIEMNAAKNIADDLIFRIREGNNSSMWRNSTGPPIPANSGASSSQMDG